VPAPNQQMSAAVMHTCRAQQRRCLCSCAPAEWVSQPGPVSRPSLRVVLSPGGAPWADATAVIQRLNDVCEWCWLSVQALSQQDIALTKQPTAMLWQARCCMDGESGLLTALVLAKLVLYAVARRLMNGWTLPLRPSSCRTDQLLPTTTALLQLCLD
jgi:hypothetical protein